MKIKRFVVKVQEEDDVVSEIEVDNKFIDFYKKETNHSHVSLKGLTKFINRLVFLHSID
jgi:hypothetical protein